MGAVCFSLSLSFLNHLELSIKENRLKYSDLVFQAININLTIEVDGGFEPPYTVLQTAA